MGDYLEHINCNTKTILKLWFAAHQLRDLEKVPFLRHNFITYKMKLNNIFLTDIMLVKE